MKKRETRKKRVIKSQSDLTAKYLTVLQNLPDIVYKMDPEGYFTLINDSVCVLGYKPKELIGKHFRKIIHPDDVKAFGRHYVLPKYKGKVTGDKNAPKLIDERRTGRRRTRDLTIRLIPKDRKRTKERIGEVIAFGDVSSTGYYDAEVKTEKKEFLGTLGIIRDITERTELNWKIKESEEKFETLFEKANDVIIYVDKHGKILNVNEKAMETIGYKRDEIIKKNIFKLGFFKKKDLPKILALFRNTVKRGKLRTRDGNKINMNEFELKHKNGNSVFVETNTTIVKKNGKIQGFLNVVRDITERKLTDAKLHYQADLLANVSDAIYSVDLDSNIRTWNEAAKKMYGWEAWQVIDKPAHEVTKIEYPQRVVNEIHNQVLKKGLWEGNVREHRKDGKVIIVRKTVSPVKDALGNSIGFVAVNRDITQLRKTEEELRQSEEKYRSIFEAAPDGIVTVNLRGEITAINTPFCKWTGYSKKELIGKHISNLPTVRTKDVPKYIEIFNAIRKGRIPKPFEFQWIQRNGTTHWIEVHVSVMKKGGKVKAFQAITRDITERKKAERELKESEFRYKELADSITDIFFGMDKELKYTYWNKASEDLTGIKTKDAIGKSIYDIFPDTASTRKAVGEYRKVLRTNQPRTFTHEYELKGKTYVFEITAYPSINGLSVFVKDITDRKKSEEKLHAALKKLEIQKQRMAELTKKTIDTQERERHYLASEIHDDLLQDLVAVLYYIQMIDTSKLDKKMRARKKRLIRLINSSISRSRALISEIEPIREPEIGLIQAVKKSSDLNFVGTAVKIKFSFPEKLPKIDFVTKANILRIVQEALMNIRKHAKATMISVKMSSLKNKLVVEIKDNGAGFDTELASEKTTGHYGLLSMKERANLNGGELTVNSKLGKGTIVKASFLLNEK